MKANLCASLVLVSLFASCGGGGGGSAVSAETDATFAVSDTSTDRQLEVFEVDLVGLELDRPGAGSARVPVARSRVDLVQLDELSEIVLGAGVPPGAYIGMTLTLDFSEARAVIAGASAPATIRDQNGVALTGPLAVKLEIASTGRQPKLVLNRSHFWVLDLDLDSAISVDTSANEVTFTPVIEVRVDPVRPKPTSIHGTLVAADEGLSSFQLERPTRDSGTTTRFTVLGTPSTLYEIDGIISIGAAGLARLAALPTGTTNVRAQGELDATRRILRAYAVESGSGTIGNGQDGVVGHIVARDQGAGSDATLTVLGRSLPQTGAPLYETRFAVRVARQSTKVVRRGSDGTLNTDALQVGQRIEAFGILSGTTLDATSARGIVRPLLTSVHGVASAAPNGALLTIDVARIDGRAITAFDFSVAGNAEVTPSRFAIDLGKLSWRGITAGSKVLAFGWMNPVGIVGDADFTAQRLVDRSIDAQMLLAQWAPPASTVLLSLSTAGITFDVQGAKTKVVIDGFAKTQLQATPHPSLLPRSSESALLLVQGDRVIAHDDFGDFATALRERLTGGARVRAITGVGTFTAPTQSFSADAMTIVLTGREK